MIIVDEVPSDEANFSCAPEKNLELLIDKLETSKASEALCDQED